MCPGGIRPRGGQEIMEWSLAGRPLIDLADVPPFCVPHSRYVALPPHMVLERNGE